ncbi:MAG: DUF6088 family protein [Spirochaetes bacterium]|nr:DUF6088 family protein [Spirochaetota bacterium]
MKQLTSDKIISRIYGYGRGTVFTPIDFSDIADSGLVRQTVTRLTKKGTIRRLMRGVYEYPRYSDMLRAPAPPDPDPDPDAIAHAIARARGWTILPSGETALNILGLSTQVSAAWEYLSDGPSKSYRWSGGLLRFRRRANWETTILSLRFALVVQALKTLGEQHVDVAVIRSLAFKLRDKEKAKLLKEARYSTAWVYEAVKRICKTSGRSDV